jgi:hypothetical protein
VLSRLESASDSSSADRSDINLTPMKFATMANRATYFDTNPRPTEKTFAQHATMSTADVDHIALPIVFRVIAATPSLSVPTRLLRSSGFGRALLRVENMIDTNQQDPSLA